MAYYRTSNSSTLQHTSMCVIRDSGKHSTATVFTFQKTVSPHLQNILTNLVKIHYFSNRCTGQYKNLYNFINLCYHKQNFNLDCEWYFFATSHGKRVCDDIGGMVKRLTAKASLQRPVNKQILTPQDMFDFCKEAVTGQLIVYCKVNIIIILILFCIFSLLISVAKKMHLIDFRQDCFLNMK